MAAHSKFANSEDSTPHTLPSGNSQSPPPERYPSPPDGQADFFPTAPPASMPFGKGPEVPPFAGSGSIPPYGPPSSQHLPTPSYSGPLLYNAAHPGVPPGIPVNKHQDISQDPKKSPSTLEKVTTVIAVGLASLVIIGLMYTVHLKPLFLEFRPVGPLVGGVILLLLNISVASWLCTDFSTSIGMQGLVPIGFAVVGCILFIIYFAGWVSIRNGGVWDLNFTATSLSAAVFSGIALGNVVGYLFFDRS